MTPWHALTPPLAGAAAATPPLAGFGQHESQKFAGVAARAFDDVFRRTQATISPPHIKSWATSRAAQKQVAR